MGEVVSLKEWKAQKPTSTSAEFKFGAAHVVITFERPPPAEYPRTVIYPGLYYQDAVAWWFSMWGVGV